MEQKREHQEMCDMMTDEFIEALVDMEIDGINWNGIMEIMTEYSETNGISTDDLRRLYGDELVRRGLN